MTTIRAEDVKGAREMVDALREVLGLQPLYKPQEAPRYITPAMQAAMGTGNHHTSARSSEL